MEPHYNIGISDGEEGEEEEEEEWVAVSHVGEGLTEVPATLAAIANLRALCLHGNTIRRIEGLSRLPCLCDLNLSSNCLESIEGLRGLSQLTSLNLASNNLAGGAEGLEGLHALRRLTLSHNFLTSLQGLSALHGGALEVLDVRDNAISSLQEFSVLAGCPNLTELLVEGGVQGNPVCQQPTYRLAVTAALPQLEKLDGRPVNPAEAMQYLAALHLQAFQPVQPPQPLLLLPDSVAAVDASTPPPDLRLAGSFRPESPQILAAPAAVSQVPHEWLHNAVTDAGGAGGIEAQPGVGRCSQSSAHVLGVDQQQQHCMQGQPPEGTPEWQLSQLLETFPGLMGSLAKALRAAVGETHSSTPQRVVSKQAATGGENGSPNVACAAPASKSQEQQPCPIGQKGSKASPAANALPPQLQHTAIATQTEASGRMLDQLQAQVEQLQEEIEALNAEAEVRNQVQAQREKEAAVALQQAEQYVLEARQQAEAVVQQARLELAAVQERCNRLEAQVADQQGAHSASTRRQQDLEYELGRAWEELEHAEHALQHQRAQHDVAVQQQELQLVQARKEAQQSAVVLAEAASRQEVLQRQLDEHCASLSRLQAERDALEKNGSQKAVELQQQLEAARVQLQEQQQLLQQTQARESDAREQLKQLSATLGSVHSEHEAVIAALRHQHTQELRDLAADRMAAVSAALEERDSVQARLAATEAEFRCALQEGAKECGDMRRDLELLAADGVELRRALQEEHQKRKEAEAMVAELAEVAQHQKLRLRGLAQEKAEVVAQLAATNPQELERLRGELLTLRERAGELGAIRDQLVQERRLAESLQQRLAMAQQQLVDAREEAARKVASADAAMRSAQEDAGKKVAAAELAASEASGRTEQLAEEASRLRDAVKVKEAMLDSANERIAELKNAAATAQAAAEEARLVAEEAEEELRAREGNDSDKLHSLRAEVEAQEQIIEQLEKRLAEAERKAREAEKRATTAVQAAAEKENMIAYVGEEVERVKGMFEQKEARLGQERDTARKEASQLRAEHETLGAMVQQLEATTRELAEKLRAEQAKAASALQAAERHQAEAASSRARVGEVEEELREVLGALEQHKAASAAKFQQLQAVLRDLQMPFLQMPI